MSFVMTLWDLLPSTKRKKPIPQRRKPAPSLRPVAPKRSRRDGPAAQRYEHVQKLMLQRYRVRVRKWRTSTSGVAWQVTYEDGTVARLIESPRPRGPISAAVFQHEIGHHAIGFGVYKPRCLEEYHAWRFSLEQMRKHGLPITQRLHDRVHDALHYAVAKAARRGLKRLPVELEPFIKPRRGEPAKEIL